MLTARRGATRPRGCAARARLETTVASARDVERLVSGVVQQLFGPEEASDIALVVELAKEHGAAGAGVGTERVGPLGHQRVVAPVEHVGEAVHVEAREVGHLRERRMNELEGHLLAERRVRGGASREVAAEKDMLEKGVVAGVAPQEPALEGPLEIPRVRSSLRVLRRRGAEHRVEQ